MSIRELHRPVNLTFLDDEGGHLLDVDTHVGDDDD